MYDKLGSTDILMYDFFNLVSAVFLFIYNYSKTREKMTFLGNKSKILLKVFNKRGKPSFLRSPVFYAVAETTVISLFQYAPIRFLTVKFGMLVDTGANYFGFVFFVPVFVFAICYFLSVNPIKQMDILTPSFPLALIFVKLACFCNGCCQGFECEWGMTNYYYSSGPKNEFPAQLLESVFALVLFVFLLWYKKRAKEGTMFPVYVIAYSVLRFISEFTRAEPNVLGILKMYQIISVVGIMIGFAEFKLVLRFSEKIASAFDRKVYPWYKEKRVIQHKKRK